MATSPVSAKARSLRVPYIMRYLNEGNRRERRTEERELLASSDWVCVRWRMAGIGSADQRPHRHRVNKELWMRELSILARAKPPRRGSVVVAREKVRGAGEIAGLRCSSDIKGWGDVTYWPHLDHPRTPVSTVAGDRSPPTLERRL